MSDDLGKRVHIMVELEDDPKSLHQQVQSWLKSGQDP